ncbi:MAG TPA: phage holin family protein [Burkholderiaceae bacterium]|nr:phage holin family protein [Burkholderiaceae bacterium]
MRLVLGWAINACVLLLLPYLVPAVQMRGFGTALVAALVIGLLNTIVRPVLVVLTLPITLLTLGLFLFVVNGITFWLAARLLPGFEIAGFGWAVIAAIVYTIATWAIGAVLLRRDA